MVVLYLELPNGCSLSRSFYKGNNVETNQVEQESSATRQRKSGFEKADFHVKTRPGAEMLPGGAVHSLLPLE